jgi:hypothetical protein
VENAMHMAVEKARVELVGEFLAAAASGRYDIERV